MSEENESQVPSVVKERVAKIVFSIKKFLKRQSSIIFWTILLLLAVLAFPKVRDLVASKRVVLLTGPEGGLYRKMGHEIEDDFVEHSPWKFWGRSFSLTSQSTHGDEENRQIVAEDNSGKYLGFAQDGFMPSPNIRGVLHLYDAPLHIVVRKSFYESVRPPKVTAAKSDQTQSPEPETFSDIASKLRSDDYAGKVFLGLDRSGTRQTASVVLKHYGIDPDKVATTRDYDLKGAAYALIDRSIDVAFFTAQRGAPILDLLAKEQQDLFAKEPKDLPAEKQKDSLLMLSLDDADGICSRHPYLLRGNIARHAYSSAKDFPNHNVETVASRQVLICSANMSDADVFWLAKAIDSCLRQKLPEVPWAHDISAEKRKTDFLYPRHAGAVKFEKEEDPGIVAGMKYVIAVVLAPIVLKCLNSFAAFFWGLLITSGKPTSLPKLVGFEELHADQEDLLNELGKQPAGIAPDLVKVFTARADELDKSINVSFEKDAINAVQRESLVRGQKYVRYELGQLAAPVKKADAAADGSPAQEPVATPPATIPTTTRRSKSP